ncbi:MAG TPA: GAF domain-containing protein, partial [Methylomirabilota bacterium]|nr:GAF domain-containing protein [Methylomirabilota bacterium]
MQSDVRLSVVESLDDAVVVVDEGRIVVAWNARMERWTGCGRAQALGRPVDEVFAALPRAIWNHPIVLALAGERGRGPATAVDAASGPAWLEPQWAPRADAPGAVLIFRDVTDERKRALFVRALATVGRSLTSSLELDQVLDTIVDTAREVMGADSAMVASWDGRAEKLNVLRSAGRLTGEYAPGGIPLAGGPVSVAVSEARAVATPDILADPRWQLDTVRRRHIAREGFKAVAAAPLLVKGVARGALAVHHWVERTFTDDEIAVLALLAEQGALALENARLYAGARRSADRLRELTQLEQMVAASLDPDAVLHAIAAAAVRLVGADVVQVWSADPVAQLLRLRASSAPAGEPPVRETIRFGEGITGRTAVEKTAIYVADVTREPGALSAEWARQSGIVRLLAVPMLSGDDLLGVLTVRARSDSLAGDEDRALITTLAAQAAVAVQNAGAYADAVARGARLSTLVAVTRSITASLDTTDVIRRIVEAAAAMRPGALAAVHALDRERGAMQVTASPEMSSLPLERPIHAGLPGMVSEQQRPVLVANPIAHERTLAPDWWRQRPGASYYGVPIMVGDTLVGVLDYIVPEGVPGREEQEALNLLAAHAGVAIRNASLYQAEHVQSERIRALAAVNQRISSTLDVPSLLRTIAESAAQLTGVTFVSFWIADDRERTLVWTGQSASELAQDFSPKTVGYDDGSVGWIARHREPLVIDDVISDPRVLSPDWWRRWGLRSFAGYPVIADGELLAILVLCHSQPIMLTPNTRDMIDIFLAQAAVAVRNARLYAESQRERLEATALAETARSLALSLDFDEVADRIVEAVIPVFNAHSSSLYRLGPDGEVTAVARGGAGRASFDRRLVWPKGTGVVGRCVEARRPVWTSDVFADPVYDLPAPLREAVLAMGSRAVLATPLNVKSRIVGALVISYAEPREFADREIALQQAFADQAALALENAHLYANARDNVERLRDTQAQLVQAAKLGALGQLVSGVAHELNNPLTSIAGLTELLLERELPPDVPREHLRVIHDQAERAGRIVRNLLTFARKGVPEKAPVDLNEVAARTALLIVYEMQLHGIELEQVLSPDPVAVLGDRHELQQVLLNL